VAEDDPRCKEANPPPTLAELAHAIVHDGARIEHKVVPNLRALIDAVQNTPGVRLATLDKDGKPAGVVTRQRAASSRPDAALVEGPAGAKAAPTQITIYGGEILSCNCVRHVVRCSLRSEAQFTRTASFQYTQFYSHVWFTGADFNDHAEFYDAQFHSSAHFNYVDFHHHAQFHDIHFQDDVTFHGTRFSAVVNFNNARFLGVATFDEGQFDGIVGFQNASFNKDATFLEAQFRDKARFHGARFRNNARFIEAVFQQDAYFLEARLCGNLQFSGATVERRIVLGGDRYDGIRMDSQARIAFNKLIARPGASIELDLAKHMGKMETHYEQRRRVREYKGMRGIISIISFYLDYIVHALRLDWVVKYIEPGFGARGALIYGEDSDDAAALSIAAADYNRLRDFFRAQPSTDEHENIANFRYLDLSRKARYLRERAQRRTAIEQATDQLFKAADRGDVAAVYHFEIIRVRSWLALQRERLVCFIDWALKRNALGYLVQWQRILISGACVILGFALVYCLFETSALIHYGDTMDERWRQNPLYNAMYFSIVTFTSLGFGDIQPLGWFKMLAASEALVGIALMALFIVSWARRMAR